LLNFILLILLFHYSREKCKEFWSTPDCI